MDIEPNTDTGWVDQAEALAHAATRGPWTWDDHPVPGLSGRAGDPEWCEYDTEVIEAAHNGECGCRSACQLDLNISEADKEFIATMNPAAVLEIVAEVRKLHEQVERWQAFAMLQKAEADMFEESPEQARQGRAGQETVA